jgi:mannose-6-phosphate isomerase-like protein (cupin superfamily)
MAGYIMDSTSDVVTHHYFREVLYTAPHSQLVLMTLQPGEEIGTELHPDNDQFFLVQSGEGAAILTGKQHPLRDGVALVVPAGTEHNVINTSGTELLQLLTIYSPPAHPDGTIHRTKQEADAYEKAEHH